MKCDVLIVGASAGGVAAALAAASTGLIVYLIEKTNWIGGQLTSQGVSTPDEHKYIEQFGGTRSYYNFRNAIRKYYKTQYILKPDVALNPYFNPGNNWVSYLSFEPKVGQSILLNMLDPYLKAGNLQMFFATKVMQCIINNDFIDEVIIRAHGAPDMRINPSIVLDATDLGDFLPLCGEEGVDWVVGAESKNETGEPDAPLDRRPDWVQPLTFPFALDWSPETIASNLIPQPTNYKELKRLQNYSIKHGAITGLFQGDYPWWSYRRLLDKDNFDDPYIKSDLCMINTAGNDFYGGNVIGEGASIQALAHARNAALGYLYWLQTECPREDDPSRKGYPEFRLRKDVFDTADGCSLKPYIRESRRIRSMRSILEQEIVVSDFKGNNCRGENARAVFMPDTIGVGFYPLDIHRNGHNEPSAYVPTRPFQIPLGALIPKRLKNLLPACKNIGTTHLTNGAYRLHPIEWNIGESAGLIASYCVNKECTAKNIYLDKLLLHDLQAELLQNGIPLHWYIDMPIDHPAFEAVQMLSCLGIKLGNDNDLLFRPEEKVTFSDWKRWSNILKKEIQTEFSGARAEAAILIYDMYKISQNKQD